MRLPQDLSNLIEAVTAANENTCVVIQSGTQCEMPWADQAPAICQVRRF
jgi:beta-glucosidase